jgi:hypothetical protein
LLRFADACDGSPVVDSLIQSGTRILIIYTSAPSAAFVSRRPSRGSVASAFDGVALSSCARHENRAVSEMAQRLCDLGFGEPEHLIGIGSS